MAEKETLIQKFIRKYFTNTPANKLRSINFARTLCRNIMPEKQPEEDPSKLMVATRMLLSDIDSHHSENDFIAIVLACFNNDPSLVTFDMVADLLESDAYKNFGLTSGTTDYTLKNDFEYWLVNDSTLSKLDSLPVVDVVLEQDGIRRTAAALKHNGLLKHVEFNQKINAQVDAKINDFDETYVYHASPDVFNELIKITDDKNQDYLTKLKNINSVLCDKKHADILNDNLDAITYGASNSQARNVMLTGAGLCTNKILLAVSQRKGWTEEDFNKIYLKFPVEQRAEQFEQQNEKLEQSVEQSKSQTESNKTENSAIKKAAPKFNPVFDVVKTFAITLGGATAISTISAIPGVGSVVGPLLGVTSVVTAGVSAGIANYKKAKIEAEARGEAFNKSDAKKIALKTGIAMVGKAVPYAMAMALGPKFRAIGAGIMMAKTMFNDLERRADLHQKAVEQLEVKQGKPKNIFDRIKNVFTAVKEKRLSGADFVKAFAYGAAKGGAVYLGGTMGREIGTSVGSNISIENNNGKINIGIDTEGVKKDLSETKIGKLVGAFGGLRGANEVQLSDENLNRLSQIGKVKLTDNARATAYEENDRQFIDGVQKDWYDAQGQQNAVAVLEKAGVEDPYGVLRKLGSYARFVGGDAQVALKHLCSGNIDDNDVNQIFDSLRLIDETGDWIHSVPVNEISNSVTQTEKINMHNPKYTEEYGNSADIENNYVEEVINEEGNPSLPTQTETMNMHNPKYTEEYGNSADLENNNAEESININNPEHTEEYANSVDSENNNAEEAINMTNPKYVGEYGNSVEDAEINSNEPDVLNDVSNENNASNQNEVIDMVNPKFTDELGTSAGMENDVTSVVDADDDIEIAFDESAFKSADDELVTGPNIKPSITGDMIREFNRSIKKIDEHTFEYGIDN